MIVLLVNKKPKALGYLINDVFYPFDFINHLVKKISVDKVVYASKKRGGVVVDKKLYSYSKDYLSLLRSNKSSLVFNNIGIVERKPSKSDLNNLSSFWSVLDIKNRLVYTILDSNLDVLGFIMTDNDIYKSSSCKISMLEILNKGRGTGSLVISHLSKFLELRGLSCVSAKDFWLRNGAIFSKENQFKIPRNI